VKSPDNHSILRGAWKQTAVAFGVLALHPFTATRSLAAGGGKQPAAARSGNLSATAHLALHHFSGLVFDYVAVGSTQDRLDS